MNDKKWFHYLKLKRPTQAGFPLSLSFHSFVKEANLSWGTHFTALIMRSLPLQPAEKPKHAPFTGVCWDGPSCPSLLPCRAGGGVWFQCGTHQVHIGVQKDFVPAAKAHPAFGVSGLDALRLRLEESGISVQEDEMRAEEGIGRFYCSDPFGNRLEFMERL
ncbi:hypothetical protein BN871_CR_00050 [Paenibacillus sp. P22]|nr:hypothetical protein BN871_CR_00050 [Paenibacillus sp. P22]